MAALFIALFFVGATAGNMLQDTVLGSRVPRELRGRVSSLDWVAATAAAPLSVVIAALSGRPVGIRADVRRGRFAPPWARWPGWLLLLRSGEPSTGDARPDDVTLAALDRRSARTRARFTRLNGAFARRARLAKVPLAYHTWSTPGLRRGGSRRRRSRAGRRSRG